MGKVCGTEEQRERGNADEDGVGGAERLPVALTDTEQARSDAPERDRFGAKVTRRKGKSPSHRSDSSQHAPPQFTVCWGVSQPALGLPAELHSVSFLIFFFF